MRELSVAEQRYQVVLAEIADGETVTAFAAPLEVRRQTVHEWLAKYESGQGVVLGGRIQSPRPGSRSEDQ
jgi:hypothetical protein